VSVAAPRCQPFTRRLRPWRAWGTPWDFTREQNIEAQTDLLAEAGCEKVFAKVSGKLARRPRWDACLYLRPGDQRI
jgi:hypothetical protein